LTGFIKNLTTYEADVEDLVQETLVRVARGWDGFRGEAALSSWIFQIASNVCVDHFRARASRPEPYQEQKETKPATSADSLHDLEKIEVGACVRDGITDLPEADRRMLIKFYLDELPVKEIAAREGISTNSAKVRLHRARARFHDSCLASCDVSCDETGEVVCGPKKESPSPSGAKRRDD